MPSSSASAQACNAPPPPRGSSVNRRGSMTLPDRYEADALGHLGVEDAVNAEGRLLDGEVQPAGDARHRVARKLGP